jgi:hypothetical protein
MGTKWSNAQQLSKPPSSAAVHICLAWSIVMCCWDAFNPNVGLGPGTLPPQGLHFIS